MMPQERMVVDARLDPTDLDSTVYLDEGGTIAFYDEDGEELASTSYDDEGMKTFREAAIDAVGDDEETAAELYDEVQDEVYVHVEAPPESVGVDETLDYMAADRVEDEAMQDVMEHEYDTAMCHQCHEELDVIEADPEREGLKVRMYSCDGCGYEDHEFVEEEIREDGSVTVMTHVTDEDDLNRFVDIREDAAYKLIDRDRLDEMADRFVIEAGLERQDDLDRYITADAGTTVTVYGVDGKHREEIVSREFDEQTDTTPREMLVDGIEDGRSGHASVERYLEEMGTGAYPVVEIDGRQGTTVGMHTDGLDEVARKEAEELAEVYSKSASRPTQVPVEGLLAQLTDRHTMLREETREAVERHREDPNLELHIQDMTGGSDVEHDADDVYMKLVEEHDVRLGSMGGPMA